MNLLDLLTGVGHVLDTPGAIARNTLAGENPFQGVFDPEERTTGRGMLQALGVLGENREGFDWGDVAGFGAELVSDPLNLLGGAGIARRLMRRPKPGMNRIRFVRETDDAGSRALAKIGDHDVGIVELMPPGAGERNAARRLFPKHVNDDDTFARVVQADLHPALHGRGIGQRLYAEAMQETPARWLYNSQASDDAVRAIRALQRKGMADVKWRGSPGGPRIMKRGILGEVKGLTPDSLVRDDTIPDELLYLLGQAPQQRIGRQELLMALGLGAHNTMARM